MSESLVTTKKPAWQRPEKWFAWGGVALACYAGLNFLDVIMPMVTRVLALAAESMFYALSIAAMLGTVGFLVFSKDIHVLCWLYYEKVMYQVTRRFIEIDPIAVMIGYKNRMKKRFEEMKDGLSGLRARRTSIQALIKKKNEQYQTSMNLAKRAQASDDKGMQMQFKLQVRRAGRVEDSAVTYQGLLNEVNTWVELCEKMQEVCGFWYEDLDNTIQEETEKRDMIRDAYKTMSAAKSMLAASKDREMFDMALDVQRQDYSKKLGEIEQFLQDAKSFAVGTDLQNGIFEESAVAKLETWKQRSSSLFDDPRFKQPLALSDGAGRTVIPATATVIENSYDKLFK